VGIGIAPAFDAQRGLGCDAVAAFRHRMQRGNHEVAKARKGLFEGQKAGSIDAVVVGKKDHEGVNSFEGR